MRKETVFDNILETKKAFLYYKKQKVKKSKNWHFSKGVTPWFWSKIWKFSIFFIIGKISQQNMFDNILERKKVFLDSKIRKSKKLKNWDFSKGVSLWFGSKIWKFSIFFIIGKISQQNTFDNILERKKVFLDSKIGKSKKLKNWDFSKGG